MQNVTHAMEFDVLPLVEVTPTDVRLLRDLMNELSSQPSGLDEITLSKVLEQPSNTVFVARDQNGNVVGTLTLQFLVTLAGEHARIEDLAVAQHVRGHGIGRRLVAVALETARLRGVDHVDLTSRPSRQTANELYVQMSFKRRETNVYRYRIERNHETSSSRPDLVS